MPSYLKEVEDSQVYYQGRWIERKYFRTFVYDAKGQKLANSYDEYTSLIESGKWFSSKEDVTPKSPVNLKGRKSKHGADS